MREFLIAKVPAGSTSVFVAAESQAALDVAVRDVMAGVPMIGSTMRVRGTTITGGVVLLDKEQQTACLGNHPKPYGWSALEYP